MENSMNPQKAASKQTTSKEQMVKYITNSKRMDLISSISISTINVNG